MKKIFFKTCITLFSLTFFSVPIFAFDSPIENPETNSVNSYFGQNLGGLVSSSYIYQEKTTVKASEDGRVLILFHEQNNDSDFFPCTLGNSVILAHDDNMATVYANLDKNNFGKLISTTEKEIEASTPEKNQAKEIKKIIEYNFDETKISNKIEKGEIFATSGNSAWQKNKNSLEFQILDLNNSTSINPRLLLLSETEEIPLSIKNITLKSKNGTFYKLSDTNTLPAGNYKVYRERDLLSAPYKSCLYINGVQSDTITYNYLSLWDSKISCGENNKYSSADIYPDKLLQLTGEAAFTPGKLTIRIELFDIQNNKTQNTFNITIN